MAGLHSQAWAGPWVALFLPCTKHASMRGRLLPFRKQKPARASLGLACCRNWLAALGLVHLAGAWAKANERPERGVASADG